MSMSTLPSRRASIWSICGAATPSPSVVPTNAVRASSHRLGQRASLAVYQRADRLDGFWYPSRLNGDENVAVYGRADSALSARLRRKLGSCPELAPILATYRIALF